MALCLQHPIQVRVLVLWIIVNLVGLFLIKILLWLFSHNSWSELDANVTCKSLGFSNGTFYNYAPVNNLTSHMKLFMPRCTGNERDLFECLGTSHPETGLTVCGTSIKRKHMHTLYLCHAYLC